MVEFKVTPESLENIIKIVEAGDGIKGLTGYFSKASQAAGNLAKSSGAIAKATEKIKDQFAELRNISAESFFNKIIPAAQDAKKEFSDLGLTGSGAAVALGLAVNSLSPKIVNVASKFRSIGSITDKSTASLSGMAGSLKELGFLTPGLEMAAAMGSTIDAAHAMENQLLNTVAAAGGMDEMLKTLGSNFANLSGKSIQFSDLTADVGTAVGMTAQQVRPYAVELMKIPGALSEGIKGTTTVGSRFNEVEAVIKVARGTFQDVGEVIGFTKTAMNEFGSSTQSSLETVSRMYSAAQVLGLRMGDVKDFVTKTGSEFKYLGDNTGEAIDIMARLGPALMKSGLGPSAITDLVTTFTKGVADMDIAQKAFLAGQAGIGGGGLRGGLEIEQMMAEGKTDEVVGEMIEVLERLGGPFMSREEALAGGEGDVAKFEKQRALLTQGPFGQLAGSPEAASRLLASLKEGDTKGLAEAIGGGQKEISNSLQRGTDISMRQTNELVEMNNDFAKWLDRQTIATKTVTDIGKESFRKKELLDIAKRSSLAAVTGPRLLDENVKSFSTVLNKSANTFGEKIPLFRAAVDAFDKIIQSGVKNQKNITPETSRKLQQISEGANITATFQAPPEAPQKPSTVVTGAIAQARPAPTPAPIESARAAAAENNVVIVKLVYDDDRVQKIIKIEMDKLSNAIRSREVEGTHTGQY